MNRNAFRFGIEVLLEEARDLVVGARVGLVTHRAAVDRFGTPVLDLFVERVGQPAVCFVPEHGYEATEAAGVKIADGRLPGGVPIRSLYGQRLPAAGEMLAGLDVVLFDLQDIGVRCYTYCSTLRMVMEAAAEAGCRMVVADRPVPLANVVDGPQLEEDCTSFVGYVPVPLVYGMTPGELAVFLQRALFPKLELEVIPVRRWCPAEGWPDDDVQWRPPSPALQTVETARVYPVSVWCEAFPGWDCGRSRELAFRRLSAEGLDVSGVVSLMGSRPVHGYGFVEAGNENSGRSVEIIFKSAENCRPAAAAVEFLCACREIHGDAILFSSAGARPEWFDKLFGTREVGRMLREGLDAERIQEEWAAGLDEFRVVRRQCLLYDRDAEGGAMEDGRRNSGGDESG